MKGRVKLEVTAGAREGAQWLKVVAAFVEDLGLVPHTFTGWPTATCDSSSKEIPCFFWLTSRIHLDSSFHFPCTALVIPFPALCPSDTWSLKCISCLPYSSVTHLACRAFCGPAIPAHGRLRQEDCKLTVRLSLDK